MIIAKRRVATVDKIERFRRLSAIIPAIFMQKK